jgi:photosystem II stability/assembly factor-like uncharacterized protein
MSLSLSLSLPLSISLLGASLVSVLTTVSPPAPSAPASVPTSGTWTWVSPTPQGADLYAVATSPDGKTLVAVGQGGVVVRSTDAGATWSLASMTAATAATSTTAGTGPAAPTVGIDLQGVAFTDASTVVAVGKGGTILRSSDQGSTFQPVAAPDTRDLGAVWGDPDAKVALIVGQHGLILRSTDGGQTFGWAQDRSTADLTTVGRVTGYAAAPGAIAAAGGSTVLFSMDDGLSFTVATDLPRAPASQPTGSPAPEVIGVGDWGVMSQTPGGPLDIQARVSLPGLDVLAATLPSGHSLLWGEADDGTRRPVNAPTLLGQVFALSPIPGGAVAVGAGGEIERSTDGGKTFASVTPEPRTDLYGVGGLPNGTVIAVGRGGTILRRAPGAATFAPEPSGTSGDLRAVITAPDGNVYLAGPLGQLFVSRDGGATFTVRPTGATSDLYAAALAPDGTLYLGGDHGTLLRSGDHGMTFTALPGLDWTVTAIAAGSGGHLLVATRMPPGAPSEGVRVHGKIFHSDDGGQTFTAFDEQTEMLTLWALPSGDALAAGSWGFLQGSTDAGASFHYVHSGSGYSLNGLGGSADGQTVFVVGDLGTILRSTDGGKSFAPETSPSPHLALHAAWVAPDGTVWAVGDGGAIVRRSGR